tara:strand:+ start:212 stop:634 length:423 start_codon:yes stop_codon:yes gene_type:complete
MIKAVNKNLIFYCLLPFIILFSYWWINDENFSNLLPQIVNSMMTGMIMTLGIATICSWWFFLSRSSPIINPLILSLLLIILTYFSNLILTLNYFKKIGLHTSMAIHLSNTLEALTIILSLCFVIIVGVLVTSETKFMEEE